jgi:hypothetical protein
VALLQRVRTVARVLTKSQWIDDKIVALQERKSITQSHSLMASVPLDTSVSYPSYKSFDDLIDLDRLKSLDGYIKDKITARSQDAEFNTGRLTKGVLDNRRPGSKYIHLTERKKTVDDDEYYGIDDPNVWFPTDQAEEFKDLMDFVQTLPFKSIGRVMIMYDWNGRAVTVHRDHDNIDVCHEFIWFRTNLEKPFFVMNATTGERRSVESYSAWFDTVNQFHGGDATHQLGISLRVDGKFSDALRAKIPTPSVNAASTASLWACAGDRGALPG